MFLNLNRVRATDSQLDSLVVFIKLAALHRHSQMKNKTIPKLRCSCFVFFFCDSRQLSHRNTEIHTQNHIHIGLPCKIAKLIQPSCGH